MTEKKSFSSNHFKKNMSIKSLLKILIDCKKVPYPYFKTTTKSSSIFCLLLFYSLRFQTNSFFVSIKHLHDWNNSVLFLPCKVLGTHEFMSKLLTVLFSQVIQIFTILLVAKLLYYIHSSNHQYKWINNDKWETKVPKKYDSSEVI